MLGVLICIVIAAFVSWHIISPHLVLVSSAPVSERENDLSLFHQKECCLQSLKDLELDFSTNRISSDDYQQAKLVGSLELAEILQRIDRGRDSGADE